MSEISNGRSAMPSGFSAMSKVEINYAEGGTTLSPEQAAKLKTTVAPNFFDSIKKLVDAIAPRPRP